MNDDHAWAVEDIARDLDLVVFDLEQRARRPEPATPAEDDALRRRLERLRDRLQDLAARMQGR